MSLTERQRDPRVLCMFTIYRLPDATAHPYAVHEWLIGVDGSDQPVKGMCEVASSLESARRKIPPWAGHRLPREDDDDPAIVETWL